MKFKKKAYEVFGVPFWLIIWLLIFIVAVAYIIARQEDVVNILNLLKRKIP